MKKFWRTAQTPVHIPWLDSLQDTFDSLGRGSRSLFIFFAMLLFMSSAGLLYTLKQSLVVEVPARGGSLSEGFIGSPRFINPILAISDADRDLTSLTYSGL